MRDHTIKQPTRPIVSVIMPTYNSEKFVGRAVKSVLQQTYQELELIIVDDGSSDNTVSLLMSFAENDSRIAVYPLVRNSGPSVARNTGMARATGRWICFLDADDAFEPVRLEVLLAHANRLSLTMIADNLRLYDSQLEQVGKVAFGLSNDVVPLTAASLLQMDKIGHPTPLGWMKPMLDRRFVIENDLRFDSNVRYGEDFIFFFEVLMRRPAAAIVRNPQYIYSTRVGSESGLLSGNSRTTADMDAFSQNLETIYFNYIKNMTPNERRLFKSRIEDARSFAEYFTMRKYFDRRQAFRFIWCAISSPVGSRIFFRKAAIAMNKRVTEWRSKK